ncbi:hypothetical protein SSBG_00824 [Streptomyces sp. SPB074]|nr:hypothetical protein SSBG_00824 [Streptomyces sp. SPB074]
MKHRTRRRAGCSAGNTARRARFPAGKRVAVAP